VVTWPEANRGITKAGAGAKGVCGEERGVPSLPGSSGSNAIMLLAMLLLLLLLLRAAPSFPMTAVGCAESWEGGRGQHGAVDRVSCKAGTSSTVSTEDAAM